VESLNSCQTIVRQNRRIFPSYCTGNILQKACGKFESLKQKKLIFPYFCTGIEQTIFKKIDCGNCQNEKFCLTFDRQ
jgi:hypothetical protein